MAENQQELASILANPQVLNSYIYTANNPVKYVDPDGEFLFLIPAIPYIVTGAVALLGSYSAWQTGATLGYALEHDYANSELAVAKNQIALTSIAIVGEGALAVMPFTVTNSTVNKKELPVLTDKIGDSGQGYYPSKNVGFRLDSKGRVLDGKYPANGDYKAVVKDNNVIFGKERTVQGGGDTFSHVDLVNGENVNFAGTMRFKNGQLQNYNEYSGHYQGTGNQWVLEGQFEKSGINYSGKFKNWQ